MDPIKARTLFKDRYIENAKDIPVLKLEDWRLIVESFKTEITITSEDLLKHKQRDIPVCFECEWCDRLPYIYSGINFADLLDEDFMSLSDDAIGIEVSCRDGYENFLSNDQIFFGGFYLTFKKDGKSIPHIKGGPVRGLFKHVKGKYSPRYLNKIKFVTNSRYDPRDPRYTKL